MAQTKATGFAERNLAMLVDFYELTMANGYFENGRANQIVYFDMFFRKIPNGGGLPSWPELSSLSDTLKT